MKSIVALAGGVGGARMSDGLAEVLPPGKLTVIVNTGDDFEHLGLYICPDLDTVCYTLAGLANSQLGWGREGDTWEALSTIEKLGGPSWFRLGDRDIGWHLERSRRLRRGQPLSRIMRDFCDIFEIASSVIPMSDDPLPTWVDTDQGELAFQEYFVKRQCHPRVKGFRFEGVERAKPAPGVLESIHTSEFVVICPSNPWVSIDPILSIPGVRQAVREKVVIAVSPIIGGKTVKGPAAKMYAELGIQPSALAVAHHYDDILTGFVIDREDENQASAVSDLGIEPYVCNTWMKTRRDRQELAKQLIEFGSKLVIQ